MKRQQVGASSHIFQKVYVLRIKQRNLHHMLRGVDKARNVREDVWRAANTSCTLVSLLLGSLRLWFAAKQAWKLVWAHFTLFAQGADLWRHTLRCEVDQEKKTYVVTLRDPQVRRVLRWAEEVLERLAEFRRDKLHRLHNRAFDHNHKETYLIIMRKIYSSVIPVSQNTV